MPLFQVTFMNHIVETYLVEADNEEAAWETEPFDMQPLEPERWDCTSCEVMDVRPVEGVSVAAYHADAEIRRESRIERYLRDLDPRDAS